MEAVWRTEANTYPVWYSMFLTRSRWSVISDQNLPTVCCELAGHIIGQRTRAGSRMSIICHHAHQ